MQTYRGHPWVSNSFRALGVLAAFLACVVAQAGEQQRVSVSVRPGKGQQQVVVSAPGAAVIVRQHQHRAKPHVAASAVQVQRTAEGIRVKPVDVVAQVIVAQRSEQAQNQDKQEKDRVEVQAPGAGVVVQERENGQADVDVAAPGVRVQRSREGVRVIAPFVDLFVPAQDPNQEPQQGQPSEEGQRIVAERRAYLGVILAPVPEILAAQLPDVLSEGGALVTEVAENSPAAKAGLKQYDIILKFGDKKVRSPEDVVQAVLGSKPGTKVKLTVLRQGKTVEIEVTLGERLEPIRPFGPVPPSRLRVIRPVPQPQIVQPVPPRSGRPAPTRRFFELSINRENDRVSVKAAWSEDGQRRELTLEGTPEDVRKQLREREDIPADVKRLIEQNLEGTGRRGFRFYPFFGFSTDEGFFGGPMIIFDQDGDFRLWIDSTWPDSEEILRSLPPDTPPEIRREIERTLRGVLPPARPRRDTEEQRQEGHEDHPAPAPNPAPAPPPGNRVL